MQAEQVTQHKTNTGANMDKKVEIGILYTDHLNTHTY